MRYTTFSKTLSLATILALSACSAPGSMQGTADDAKGFIGVWSVTGGTEHSMCDGKTEDLVIQNSNETIVVTAQGSGLSLTYRNNDGKSCTMSGAADSANTASFDSASCMFTDVPAIVSGGLLTKSTTQMTFDLRGTGTVNGQPCIVDLHLLLTMKAPA